MRITRASLAAAAAVAGMIAMAGPAQAAPPPTVSQSIPLDGTDTAGRNGYCPFPVVVDYVTRQKTRVTTNPDGSVSQRFTGPATATVTHVGTPKSITYKVNGPGTLTTYPDDSFTIDAGGQNLFWTTVENSFLGVPQLSYTTGHVQVAVNASGQTTDYSLSGRRTDVCAALA
jgi:hypothetical protein